MTRQRPASQSQRRPRLKPRQRRRTDKSNRTRLGSVGRERVACKKRGTAGLGSRAFACVTVSDHSLIVASWMSAQIGIP